MKKFQLRVFQAFIMVMLGLGSFALTSCNDDDDDAPAIVAVDGINYILGDDNTCTVTVGNYIGAVNIPGAIESGDRRYQVTKIGAKAFMSCTELTSVDIPNTVTRIDIHAFDGCANLTSVTLPANLVFIGNYAFNGCGLTEVTIPDAVTTIGAYSFQNNPMKELSIGSNVALINWCAFQGSKIEKVKVYPSVPPTLDYYPETDMWPFDWYTLQNGTLSVVLPAHISSTDIYASYDGWSYFAENDHEEYVHD